VKGKKSAELFELNKLVSTMKQHLNLAQATRRSGVQNSSAPRSSARRATRKRRKRNARGGGGSAPIAIGNTQVNRMSSEVTLSGTDYIDSLTITPTTQDGSAVSNIAASPIGLEGTRLAALAKTYEKFRPVRLDFIIRPKLPTTVGGGYIAGFSPDPEILTSMADGSSAKRSVRSLSGSVSSQWWQPSSVVWSPSRDDRTWYYCSEKSGSGSGTERFVAPGMFWMVVDGAPNNITGTFTVSIEFKWTIRFQGPVTDSSGSTGPMSSYPLPPDTLEAHPQGKAVYCKGSWLQFCQDYPALPNSWQTMVFAIFPAQLSSKVNERKDVKYIRFVHNDAGSWAFTMFRDLAEAWKASDTDYTPSNGMTINAPETTGKIIEMVSTILLRMMSKDSPKLTTSYRRVNGLCIQPFRAGTTGLHLAEGHGFAII